MLLSLTVPAKARHPLDFMASIKIEDLIAILEKSVCYGDQWL